MQYNQKIGGQGPTEIKQLKQKNYTVAETYRVHLDYILVWKKWKFFCKSSKLFKVIKKGKKNCYCS